MLPLEHSAILLTFIRLSVVIKTFVLSIFEWLFYTGFTVLSMFYIKKVKCQSSHIDILHKCIVSNSSYLYVSFLRNKHVLTKINKIPYNSNIEIRAPFLAHLSYPLPLPQQKKNVETS